MKQIAILMLVAVICSCKDKHDEMDNNSIFPIGEPLPRDWFTGTAYLHPMIAKDKNHEFSAGSVTFEPTVRTNWHTHPKG